MSRYNGYSGSGGDYGYGDDSSSSTDASRLISRKVNVSDDGHLTVFGKDFDVGPQFATILRPLVTTALNEVSLRGSAAATHWGTQISGMVMSPQWAAKTGKGAGFVWLFGLSAADVGFSIKKTVNDGYKDMHELRDQWQPLLAANNSMDVGVGKALTCNCGVFAHARAKVYEKSKRNVLATISGGIRAIPNIWMGIYQHQLNNIQNPERAIASAFPKRVVDIYTKGGVGHNAKDRAMLVEIEKMHTKLLAKQSADGSRNIKRADADPENVAVNLFNWGKDKQLKQRLLHPASENDYAQNIHDLRLTPALFDLGGGLIERYINKKDDSANEDAGDKILALQSYVQKYDMPDRAKVVESIHDIFQQRAKDLGRKYEVEGDTFDRVTEAVADAVIYGLHPQAVAEVLDNKKIVAFGAKDADFGEVEAVNTALAALKAKYTTKVSEKQFYKNAPFTKESLIRTFKDVPEEEKPFFVMLFPEGILEKAGVDKAAVKKYRDAGKENFVSELTGMAKMLMDESPDQLKKRGVKSKVIEEFEAFKEAFSRSGSDEQSNEFMEKGADKASRAVRNVALSVKKPADLWQGYLKKRGEEAAARIPTEERKGADHIASENETGDDTGAPGRQM